LRTATIVIVFLSLAVILLLLGIMLVHWRRFRAETDRYRAWQSVFGQRGAKVALTVGFVALAVLTGALGASRCSRRDDTPPIEHKVARPQPPPEGRTPGGGPGNCSSLRESAGHDIHKENGVSRGQ